MPIRRRTPPKGAGKIAHPEKNRTGPGLQPEVLERVFEPYFTTKESGTGMGLPICRSTVEAHHGRITVTTNPAPSASGGHGALFRIWLPASE